MSTKISDMIRITSVNADGSLTVVQNGQNFQISQSDYVKQFGTTGSIVQAGDSQATPVLDPQGSVNNIRNLEDGSGVKSSVSAQNGITLAHNFTVDSVGAPIMLNKTLTSPTFPSLLGSATIAVQVVGDQIRFDLTGAPISTKTVLVDQMSDFPAPVGGVITLETDTDYLVTNDLTTADRFILSDDTQIRGSGAIIINLTYTGTGAMFTCQDCDTRLKDITITFSSGSCFNVTSSTAAGIGIVFAENVVFVGATFGSVHCRILTLSSCGVALFTDGLTATGTTGEIFAIVDTNWFQTVGTGIDLGTVVFQTVQADNMFLTLSSGVDFLTGAANSVNINSTGEGLITKLRKQGDGSINTIIDADDDRWFFSENSGDPNARDTIRDGIVSVQGNATETVIAIQSTPVKVAGTFTVGRNSGYTPDTTGRVTYDLLNKVIAPVTVSASLQMASGGAQDLKMCLAVNGSVIADSCIEATAASSTKTPVSLTWQVELTQTDFVEAFIQNDSGTTNVMVTSMILRVN